MAKTVRDLTLEALADLKADMKDVNSRLASIDSTLAQQKTILDEHVRRTGLAEEAIKATSLLADAAVKAAALVKEQSRSELQHATEPLREHLAAWAGAGKVMAVIGTLITIGAAVYKVFF